MEMFDVLKILVESDLDGPQGNQFIQSLKNHYGLANITYVSASFPGYSLLDPLLVTTLSPAWLDHYRKEEYFPIDPVVNAGAYSLHALDWRTLPKRNKKVRGMFEEAESAGVGRNGLAIPVGDFSAGGLLSVSSYETDTAWSQWCCEYLKEIVMIALCIHQRACDLYIGEPPFDLNSITKREREVIAWSAEGKTVAEMAAVLGKSPETVRSHLESARIKLRARNRPHAVAKAVRAGLVR